MKRCAVVTFLISPNKDTNGLQSPSGKEILNGFYEKDHMAWNKDSTTPYRNNERKKYRHGFSN